MLLHQGELLLREPARLCQHGFRHPNLADVVDKPGNVHAADRVLIQPHRPRQLLCEVRNPLGVAAGVGVLGINRSRQCFEGPQKHRVEVFVQRRVLQKDRHAGCGGTEQLHVDTRNLEVRSALLARDQDPDHRLIATDGMNEHRPAKRPEFGVGGIADRVKHERNIWRHLREQSGRRIRECLGRMIGLAGHDELAGKLLEPIAVVGELGADPRIGKRRKQLLADDANETGGLRHHRHALDGRIEEVHLLIRLGQLLTNALQGRADGGQLKLVPDRVPNHRHQPGHVRIAHRAQTRQPSSGGLVVLPRCVAHRRELFTPKEGLGDDDRHQVACPPTTIKPRHRRQPTPGQDFRRLRIVAG